MRSAMAKLIPILAKPRGCIGKAQGDSRDFCRSEGEFGI